MSIRDIKGGEGGSTQRALPKRGPRPAVLIGLVDIGIQQRTWEKELKKPCREILPIFELVKDSYETDEGEKHNIKLSPYPMAIMPGADKSKYVALCKALDPDNKVLDKKGRGDITKLLGSQCMVTVLHKEPTAEGIVYSKITGVSELPEDYPTADAETVPYFFDACDPDPAVAATLPNFVKEHIRTSLDYAGSALEAVVEGTTSAVPDGADQSDDDEDGEDSPI